METQDISADSRDEWSSSSPEASTGSASKPAVLELKASGNKGQNGKRASGRSRGPPDTDRKSRREIANNNERRRMMCINNGFESLQAILPKELKKSDKISKAVVLQRTVDFINELKSQNSQLLAKNDELTLQLSVPHADSMPLADIVPHVDSVPRVDSGGESTEEGVSPERAAQPVTDTKELVNMIQHWRKKCSKERSLRIQQEKSLRLVISDLEKCPAGCGKRDYSSILQRSPKSLAKAGKDAVATANLEKQNLTGSVDGVTSVSVSDTSAPASIAAAVIKNKRKIKPLRCPCGSQSCNVLACPRGEKESAAAVPQKTPLTGFDILYEAITYSEHNWYDCNNSDSECSEASAEPSEPVKKKRQKQQRLCA